MKIEPNNSKGLLPLRSNRTSAFTDVKKDWDLYLLLIPGLVFLAIFRYAPMYGLVIAFKDFNIYDGIAASPWVGFENFHKLFTSPAFYEVFKNTLLISIYKIVFLFPFPILIAILLNEIRNMAFKRSVQTVIYLPHFLSWVIVSGIFINVLSVNGGIINNIIQYFGGQPIRFFMDNNYFRSVIVTTAGWKEVGWSTIVYLAAITGIDPQLYEAATIDGANRFKQALYVTLPGMTPTIVLMFILRLGSILEAGTEQILAMYNPTVYKTADVIGTYVYRVGLGQSDYSFTTAVGLFESIVALTLILSGNYLCRKFLNRSIW
ncbi:ABC transporter permease subunit [Clostridium swellfunianum]|uniref:ABC transporter permease n=1 Tax=Clostridium swellfunianum TaxID=1367462 RepID=UPI00202EB6B8|nr:ABC transporter permease subunit [Clostridium swellfunianum]MCM0649870.1 ABC transporter permease subunit [Clostridium swellfunianum]